jgi:hypothetical protein
LLLFAEGLLFCFDIFAVLVAIPDSSPGDVINQLLCCDSIVEHLVHHLPN